MKKLTFANLPEEHSRFEHSKVVILPVPYEGTVSYGKGTSKGPDAILRASHEFELYHMETDSEPYEHGIHTADPLVCPSDAKENAGLVEKKVTELLEDLKFPVVVGGEHSISIGSARAYADRYEDLSVLQLDAHADLLNEFDETKYSHACTMRRISELGIPIVQVGVRSMDLEEKYCDADVTRIDTQDEDWIGKTVGKLKKDVFITLDVDVFDPSIMPSTGTPEPGGLLWNEVTHLLSEVCRNRNVVGVDIVELAPVQAIHAPDYMVAKLIYSIIAYRYNGKEALRESP